MENNYKSQLMGTTALCHPTYHKGLGGVIAIVASIAIPFAAPAIAGAIGLSAAIGSAALGGAIVGTVLGAGLAAVTGGNVIMGGIGGALAGGIAGYNMAPGAVSASPVSNISQAGFPSPPAPATVQGASGIVSSAPTGFFDPMPQTAVTGAPISAAAAPVTNASILSGGGPDAATWGQGYISPPPTAIRPGTGTALSSAPTVNATTLSSAPIVTAGVQPSASAPPGFFDSLPDFLTGDAVKQGVARLLTNAVVTGGAGDVPDMSAEEKQLLARRNAALNQQEKLLVKKVGLSDKYIQLAGQIDPDAAAAQARLEEQNRLARLQQAGVRAIPSRSTGERLSTLQRYALDRSRLAGYTKAQSEAEAKRLRYIASAANVSPTGYNYTGTVSDALTRAGNRYGRLEGAAQEGQEIFAPIFADILGGDLEKKKEEEEGTITGV